MASEVPVVRNFQACLAVELDPGDQSVTLRTLVHAIVRLPGEAFPCFREELALYALMTNGRGAHDFMIVMTRFDMGQEFQIATVGPVSIDLGQDPVAVLGMPVPMRNLVFERPGQYSFHLVCDNQPIADVKVAVR